LGGERHNIDGELLCLRKRPAQAGWALHGHGVFGSGPAASVDVGDNSRIYVQPSPERFDAREVCDRALFKS
jgi:hypothetical protein